MSCAKMFMVREAVSGSSVELRCWLCGPSIARPRDRARATTAASVSGAIRTTRLHWLLTTHPSERQPVGVDRFLG